jgi:hypothetical protein
MLPDHEYPIPQGEPLIRITRNGRIHRSMLHCHTRRRRNHPPHVLIRSVPQSRPGRGDCGECRGGLDWRVGEATRPPGSMPANWRPKGSLMPRAAAQAQSGCGAGRHLHPCASINIKRTDVQGATLCIVALRRPNRLERPTTLRSRLPALSPQPASSIPLPAKGEICRPLHRPFGRSTSRVGGRAPGILQWWVI